jgi:hypothetical protein
VDPATGQPLLLFPTAAHRWTGAGWSAVTISDPELDGSPSQPFSSLPAVDWYAREVVAVSAGHTWRWTGASWALAHAPYGTDGPDNHFFPLAIPNPELRRLEVCGGGGYFGPIYSDCRAWNGHTWKLLDGGMPFPPNEYGGSVAVMPDGGVLVLTKGVDAGASVWRRSGGAWSSAPSFPAMVHNGQLAWEPGAQRFFSLQTSSDVTLGHALGGTGWTQLEQGSLDAGTLPHGSYSPYSLAADPITGGLVSTGTGSWLRGATWTRLTSDPEGDGEPQLACVTTSWERGRSYAVYRELFEFTGASWRRVPITRVVPSDGAFPGIFGCFLGMLPGTSRLVVSPYGNEVFEFDFAAAAAPAVELALPLSLGGFSSNASVQGAVLRARVGGQGLVAGATLPGARARAWSNGAWTPLGQTSAPAATPGWLEVDASAAVPRWGSTAPLRLQLTPLGVNGTGSASLALDYAELTVRLKR